MKLQTLTLILTSLILMLSLTALHSQVIYFSGKDKASGETVNIDSIKIINTTLNLDTTITGNSFDLSLLDVEEENVNSNIAPFDVVQIPSEDGNSLSFRINTHENVSLSIRIYNLIGILISSYQQSFPTGVHDIKLNEYLIPGVYFASFSNGSSIRTIKILENSAPINNLVYEQKIGKGKNQILSSDSYTFIGYSKGYFPDSIKNIVPENGQNYIFELETITDWFVNTCNLSVKIPAIIHTYHRKGRSPNPEQYDRYDSTYFQFNQTFQDSLSKWSYCDTSNIRDTIVISKCYYSAYGTDIKIRLVMDTITNNMKSITFSYFEEIPMDIINQKPYIKKEISLKIDSLACSLIKNVHIIAILNNANYSRLQIIQYTEHDDYNFYGGNDDFYDYNIDKLLPVDNHTYIDIELTK
jgi:hypothetical protein